jgi:hypothetical protein
MTFLYSIPAGLLLLLAVAIGISLAAIGQVTVHRRFQAHEFITHNEVGGVIISVCGALYAVILGFLTVVAWEHFQDARQLVVQESDADIDAWHTSVGLPEAVRTHVRNDMLRYAQIMVDREWPNMRRGGFDEEAGIIVMDAIDVAATFVPGSYKESNAQNATLQQLTAMHDARQQRVAINESGVSGFEWVVLIIGAICIICFCWLFGVRHAPMHMLMTSTVVTIIVSILVLLFQLQYPFRSDVGIGPEAWQGALAHIHDMQKGEMPGMRM